MSRRIGVRETRHRGGVNECGGPSVRYPLRQVVVDEYHSHQVLLRLEKRLPLRG